MKLSVANLQHAYARLAPRERLFVAIGVATFVIVVAVLMIRALHSVQSSLRHGIAAKQRQLERVEALSAQYLALKRQADELTAKNADRSPNALYSTLEGLIKKAMSRDRIHSIDPSSRTVGDRYVEDSVNVQLLGVTLEQTVSLLHSIEQAAVPVHVSRLQIKKRVSDPYQFDVTFAVSSVKSAS
ncbi:MAG: type II secretion system protein M [Deltaproteobacteria bacterium]|nr:type II secretion system protein M [Deltaproteobacteria bacterium]